MALDITYWTGYDPITRLAYGTCISRVQATLTASDAQLGAIPANAAIARVKAGEVCVVSNNDVAASATNGVGLIVGEAVDIDVSKGLQLRGKTE